MKIRLDSYDDLPLNKILCFSVLDLIVESVFQIESQYYPPIHINEYEECKYECEYEFEYECEYECKYSFISTYK